MCGNNSTSFALNYACYHGDNSINSTTRPKHIQSLVTHGITDKADYLNKATE